MSDDTVLCLTFEGEEDRITGSANKTLAFIPRNIKTKNTWSDGVQYTVAGDQEVTGSTPAKVGNILSWRLIMKYFLRSFSPFRWFKKGSCQFLAKE